jgi:septum site-determining protein MinC
MLILRTASLSVFSLKLQSLDIAFVEKELSSLGDDLPFDDPAPIILDIAALSETLRLQPVDTKQLTLLQSIFRRYGLRLLGLRNVPKIWRESLLQADLLDLGMRRDTESSAASLNKSKQEEASNTVLLSVVDDKKIPTLDDSRVLEQAPTLIAEESKPVSVTPPFMGPSSIPAFTAPQKPAILPTVFVDKPLRSGQKVYAKGANAVVLAMVSVGAEVIADGDIHVYAPLRGRALAGASGESRARIFTTSFEAELVSVAGVWRNFADGHDPATVGKAVQVYLERVGGQEKLRIDV